MITSESEVRAVLMAEYCRNLDSLVYHRTVGIDAELLADICRKLAGLFVGCICVGLVFLRVLADFKLNPSIIAGSFAA